MKQRAALFAAVGIGLAALLGACAGQQGGSDRGPNGGAVEAIAPLTPRQASLLAETLHRNHEATGATFALVGLDEASGATLTLEGTIDWAAMRGRASVAGYSDADGPVVEVAWTSDAIAESRPSQIALLASRGEPPGTFFLRAVEAQRQPIDRLIAILAGLATLQPENAQLILQNPGAGFLRHDVVRGRDVVVLRYSARSVYWIDADGGQLVRFEARDSRGGSPVVVDILELGRRDIALPEVSALPLRP